MRQNGAIRIIRHIGVQITRPGRRARQSTFTRQQVTGLHRSYMRNSMLISFFIMFLTWKAIYYFMLIRLVLNATIREIIIITAVSALIFTVLMLSDSKVGIQVPML